MLVELIVLVIEQNTVLSAMPICSLKITSSKMPKINKTNPKKMETFKYLVVLMSFLIVCDNIKNKPKRPKNIMSFPLDEPIKKRYVTGLIIGFKISVRKIMSARTMNNTPTNIVLLTFINNTLIINTLYK